MAIKSMYCIIIYLHITAKEQSSRQIYEQALVHGYVESNSSVCLLTGAAGSGKTHTKQLIANLPPPEKRQSTALAETPIRAISFTKMDPTDDSWHPVDDDEQLQIIAAVMSPQSIPEEEEQKEHLQQVHTEEELSQELPLGDIHSPPTQESAAEMSDTSQLPVVIPNQSVSTPSPRSEFTEQKQLVPIEEVDILKEKIVNLIARSSGSRKLLDIDWIYLMDSGGQPAFQDIFPFFRQSIDITIFVTKLTERLNQHSLVAYYNKEAKLVGKEYVSSQTNEEILRQTLREVQTQALASSRNDTKLIVVGTHRDLEGKCKESRAKKNQRLTSLLGSDFKEHIVFFGEVSKEIIFPVDAKHPGVSDKLVAKQLRKKIQEITANRPRVRTPVTWYILERYLRRKAVSLGRSILSRQECLQEARKLHLDEAALDAALDHFIRLNTILYYRECLPNAIFLNPQPLLDKVTELVELSHQLRSNPSTSKATTSEVTKFREEGLVTLELLKKFPRHYVTDLFTPEHFLQLLHFRSVITPVSGGDYFMPSIMPELSREDIEKLTTPHIIAPLAFFFPGGVVPNGLFCSLVAALLSKEGSLYMRLLPNYSNPLHPECVSRNCLKFQLPGGAPGSLTLVDAYSHIEVHPVADAQVLATVCPTIREGVSKHLELAKDVLHYSSLHSETGLVCRSKEAHGIAESLPWWKRLFGQSDMTSHPTIVSFHGESAWWACCLSPDKANGKITGRDRLWFPILSHAGEYTTTRAY